MNQMALMFRLMAWFQRVRATVGPERFDRIMTILVRHRRRITWVVTALVVIGPPALAVHLRLFAMLPTGPYPAPIVEYPVLLGEAIPAVLIWIGLLWLGRAIASALVSWTLDRLGLEMLRGMLP